MALWQKLSAWFLTESGKRLCYYASGTTSIGILLGHYLPHTVLIDQYVDIFRLYKHGFCVELTDKLQQRFEKTLDLLGIEEQDKELFKPFAAYGFDIFSVGTTYSKFGVRVGIPANFFYEDKNSIDKHSIKVRDDSVVWDTEEGKLLEQCLILSENAQIFAIAREIKMRDTPKFYIDSFVPTASFLGMYSFARILNEKQNLYARPRSFRMFLYLLVGAFAYGSYVFVKDFSQLYYEKKIDEELKQKDSNFSEGGKEFYTKLVHRNIALRKLLGKEGERIYTALGNENTLLRYKHLPLVERKIFFEQATQKA